MERFLVLKVYLDRTHILDKSHTFWTDPTHFGEFKKMEYQNFKWSLSESIDQMHQILLVISYEIIID